MKRFRGLVFVWGIWMLTNVAGAETVSLKLRSRVPTREEATKGEVSRVEVVQNRWDFEQTAVIVCDVWDAHHCLNAVRRLEEFAPRMNDVLKEARKRGATIIHSPSDCMAAYEDHAARKRAIAAPAAKNKPKDVEHWCSRIPSEEQAVYPIDQSDGGEDDDPAEHAEWAAKLKAMGRNPGMPWKTQSKLIEIDADRDFISDKGDEVWNVLESRGIKNVILVGVHLNMCVLGRPFGLRQMVRSGKHVALMRDMTDCMYNPKRWPQVDHFTGNDLVIAHVERFVCPTITSDQLLGGEPFRSKYDKRSKLVATIGTRDPKSDWTPIQIPSDWSNVAGGSPDGVVWYRCVVRLPKEWLREGRPILTWSHPEDIEVWVNGEKLLKDVGASKQAWLIPRSAIIEDDFNLLVFREAKAGRDRTLDAPKLGHGETWMSLKGRWQFRIGDDKSWSNIPLPAKFGGSTDMLFELDR
jgi:nicotinamidase-related amidase